MSVRVSTPPGETLSKPAPTLTARVSLTGPWLFALLVLVCSPWVLVVLLLIRREAPAAAVGAPLKPAVGSGAKHDPGQGRYFCNPGPWGKLEMIPISLAPPLEFIQGQLNPDGERLWYFRNRSRDELEELFRTAGLSAEQREQLWACHQADLSSDMVFKPSDELVRGLAAPARQALYDVLGLDDRNADQVNVFRYRGPSVEAWLAGVALPKSLVQDIAALCYRKADYWIFADWRLIHTRVTGDQKVQLLRALDADQTWLVQLHIDEQANIEELTQYWGQGGRQFRVGPTLEALAKIPGGTTLSIRALLPPFAQSRLNTHPYPTIDSVEMQRDCHWTALNFFARIADDKFAASTDAVAEEIRTHYHPVFGNYKLGDVVLFMTEGGQLFHSAVYLADDLLFTKNGRLSATPWSLIRMQDMLNYYPQAKPKVFYYRHKESADMP